MGAPARRPGKVSTTTDVYFIYVWLRAGGGWVVVLVLVGVSS